MFINNKMVIDNDGEHSEEPEKTGKITLSKGIYPLRLNYLMPVEGYTCRCNIRDRQLNGRTYRQWFYFRNSRLLLICINLTLFSAMTNKRNPDSQG